MSIDSTPDALWQRLMQLIWRGRCAKCHSAWSCAGHHITKRRFHATRWAVMNGILLCAQCHAWAEQHESEFFGWLNSKWPVLWQWHKDNTYPQSRYYAAWEIKDVCKGLRQMIRRLT